MYFLNHVFKHAKFLAIGWLALSSGKINNDSKNYNGPLAVEKNERTQTESFCLLNHYLISPFSQLQSFDSDRPNHFLWQNDIDINQLKRQIALHIIYSSKLSDYYKGKINLLNEHTDLFIGRMINEIVKQKFFYCQLKSLLADTNFEIELSLEEDLVGENANGLYQHGNLHRISISLHAWLAKHIVDQTIVLNHELHHAFVTSENRKKNVYLFFRAAPYNITITEQSQVFVDQKTIKQAIENCKKTVTRLSNVLATPTNELDSEDQKFLEQLQKLTEKYIPRISIRQLEQYHLHQFENQGYCDIILSNWNGDETQEYTESKVSIFEVEKIEETHFGYYRLYQGDDSLSAFLTDVQSRIMALDYKKYSSMTYDLEFDAELFGLLIEYPDLYDFMMPGIRYYHAHNNNKEFQYCTEDVTPS